MITLLLMLACTPPKAPASEAPPSEAPSETPPNEVAPGIHALDGTSASLQDEDLAALDPVLEGATVIAFGESVHYSGGYHALRERGMRYAIEHHGVRAVGIEGHWYYAEQDARPYVERCEGTVQTGLAGLGFDVWASAESADFLTWLCEWNVVDHPEDPVTFFGVDVQSPWLDARYLEPVFDAVDPEGTAAFREDLRSCLGYGLTNAEMAGDPILQSYLQVTTPVPPAVTASCLVGVEAAQTWASDNQIDLETHDSEAFVLTGVALRSAQAGHMSYADRSDWDPRDAGMAGNFLDLHELRAPGSPAIYWAHNGHIDAQGDTLTNTFPEGWKDAGAILRDVHGPGYVPIALVAEEVTWNWYGQPDETSIAGENNVEGLLGALGEDVLFVDVATAVTDGSVLPGATPKRIGHPGAGRGIVEDHWDGLLWLRRSGPMERP